MESLEENKTNLQVLKINTPEKKDDEKNKGNKENQQPIIMPDTKENEQKDVFENEVKREDNLEQNHLFTKQKPKHLNKMPSKTSDNLRYSFQISLSKISSTETLDNGVKEIKEIFEKNNSNTDLSIYFPLLFDEKKTYNLLSKEALLTIFSLLFSIYNTRLSSEALETNKMMIKIRDFIIKQFEENTNGFQIACAQCLISLYHNCFKEKSFDLKLKMFIEPFLDLFQGKGNPKTHQTTSIYFQEFIIYLQNINEKDMMKGAGEKILQLFFKLKKTNIFYELLAALKTLFNGADNIVLLRDFEEKFVKKLIVFLKAESAKNQNINEYMCKVISCEILALLPQQNPEFSISQTLKIEVLDILKKNSANRIIKVQKSALLAYKEWLFLNEPEKKLFSKENPFESSLFPQEISLINPTDPTKDVQGPNQYENVVKNEENPLKEFLTNAPMKKLQEARDQYKLNKGESKYEKNFVSFFEKKRTNFMKKKTGLGGGFYPIFPKKNPEKQLLVNRNENKDVKKLKEFIVKTKKDMKKNEKVALLNEEGEKEKKINTVLTELPKENEILERKDSKEKINETISDLQIIAENNKNDTNKIENNEIKTKENETPFENKKEIEQVQLENLKEIDQKQTKSLKESLIKNEPSPEIIEEKDEFFQEEANLQGDEALAPILKQKTNEIINSLIPPSKKEFFPPQKYQPPQKNTIFDLSQQESIDNISKETGAKQIHISNDFSNIEFAPSLNNINLGDFENIQKINGETEQNLTHEVILESNEDIVSSKKMNGFKEVIDEKDKVEEKNNGKKFKSLIKKNLNFIEENKEIEKNLIILQNIKGEEEKSEKNEVNEEENQKSLKINREINGKISKKNQEEEINKKIQTKINTTEKNKELHAEMNNEFNNKENNKEIKKTMSKEINKQMNQEFKTSMENLNSLNKEMYKSNEMNKEIEKSNEINIENIKELNEKINKSNAKNKETINEIPKEIHQEINNEINNEIKNKINKEMNKKVDKENNKEIINNEKDQNKINKKIMQKIDNEIKENLYNKKYQKIEELDDDDEDESFQEYNENKFEKSSNGINFNNYQIKLSNLLENHPKKTFSTNQKCEEIDFFDYFPQRPSKKSKKIDKALPETWNNVLFSLENSDFDEAFSEILSTGDDVYLIRLMNLTGPCINKMSIKTIKEFFQRICDIMQSNFMEKVLLDFLDETLQEESIVDELNIEEQNQILEVLENFNSSNFKKEKSGIILDKFKKYLKI